MLKIPLQDIIEKIKKETSLPESQINQKIEQKLSQLAGLISKEGAAHIVANELGVKLLDAFQGKLQIKNILAGMRSVETVGKVTRKFELREFRTGEREGKVASLVIGDETASIRLVLWGEQAENINRLAEGDIIKVVGGYVRENQNQLEVHLNERSKLIINPPGESIASIKAPEKPQRKKAKELSETDLNAELLGTIVQVFEPRFYPTCPECRKKLMPDGNLFVCSQHRHVTPNFSYVLNLFLDDGSEPIRCVFFKNQFERLVNKSQEEILKYKESPQDFEAVKTELLGNIIKLVGRASKNQMFDRLEFIAQLVFTNPDPEEEIKRLEAEKPKIETNSASTEQTESAEETNELVTEEEEIK